MYIYRLIFKPFVTNLTHNILFSNYMKSSYSKLNGQLERFSDTKEVRRSWTNEVEIVLTVFHYWLTSIKLPGKAACEKLVEDNSIFNIKDYVRNCKLKLNK